VSYVASPTGAAGPFAGALRHVASYKTSERYWASEVIDVLMDHGDVCIDDIVYIEASSLHPKKPIWAQVRQRLREHGIATPAWPDEPRTREETVALLRARFGL
jgi:hypothetical protein